MGGGEWQEDGGVFRKGGTCLLSHWMTQKGGVVGMASVWGKGGWRGGQAEGGGVQERRDCRSHLSPLSLDDTKRWYKEKARL